MAGDWNNDGIVTIGVFRPSESKFYLSNRLPPTSGDVIIGAGGPEYGYLRAWADWTSTGGTKLGVFKPSTGGWYLVSQLGAASEDCATDLCGGPFGGSEDLPVAFGPLVIRAH